MATGIAKEYYESSKLAKYPFEPYWPEAKLKICVTGAGGFIASHLAKRLKSEGHHIIGCDWKRNEHMPVRPLARFECCSLPVSSIARVCIVPGSAKNQLRSTLLTFEHMIDLIYHVLLQLCFIIPLACLDG
jgi:nucleoside-diphosphate-sugar epimerase